MVRGCLPFYWATASSQPHHSWQLWWSFLITCAILASTKLFTSTIGHCWYQSQALLPIPKNLLNYCQININCIKKSFEIFCWGHKVKVLGGFLYTFLQTASSHLTDHCSYQLPTKNCASNFLEINSIQKEKTGLGIISDIIGI